MIKVNNFIQGAIDKVRFESPQGKTGLTIEQLFELPLEDKYHRVANLDDIAQLLDSKRVKVKSFVNNTKTEDASLRIKLDIVVEVIKYKQAVAAEKLAISQSKEEARAKLALIEQLDNKDEVNNIKKMSTKEREALKESAEAVLKTK